MVCLYTQCKGDIGIKDKPYISSGKMNQVLLMKEKKRMLENKQHFSSFDVDWNMEEG